MVGPVHALLQSGASLLNDLQYHEFTVDGSATRWRGLFEVRQGNNLDQGGFTQDFSGDGRVPGTIALQMEAAGTPLHEGLRLTVYRADGKALRQVQVRDLDIQPAWWVFSLASPNQ